VSLAQQAVLISNQLKYIESQLRQAAIEQPTWLIVVGHYPVYSAGDHGDSAELKTYLQPLLEKYNVDAYFCGHDHISEHLE
jgi:tartrate-resistant acid phosphatase type 5